MASKSEEIKNAGSGEKRAQALEQVKALIKEKVAEHAEHLSEEEQKMEIEALTNVFIEGKTPAEAMKLPDDFIQILYKQAYDLYNLGLYDESNGIFRILCLFEPSSPRFQLGLAATNHQLGNFEVAAAMYYASYMLDPRSPIPLFYISDCCLKMNEPESAYLFLKMAVECCGAKLEYQKLKNKCYMLMSGLRKQYGVFKDEEKIEGVPEGETDIFTQLRNEAEKGLSGS